MVKAQKPTAQSVVLLVSTGLGTQTICLIHRPHTFGYHPSPLVHEDGVGACSSQGLARPENLQNWNEALLTTLFGDNVHPATKKKDICVVFKQRSPEVSLAAHLPKPGNNTVLGAKIVSG